MFAMVQCRYGNRLTFSVGPHQTILHNINQKISFYFKTKPKTFSKIKSIFVIAIFYLSKYYWKILLLSLKIPVIMNMKAPLSGIYWKEQGGAVANIWSQFDNVNVILILQIIAIQLLYKTLFLQMLNYI